MPAVKIYSFSSSCPSNSFVDEEYSYLTGVQPLDDTRNGLITTVPLVVSISVHAAYGPSIKSR